MPEAAPRHFNQGIPVADGGAKKTQDIIQVRFTTPFYTHSMIKRGLGSNSMEIFLFSEFFPKPVPSHFLEFRDMSEVDLKFSLNV